MLPIFNIDDFTMDGKMLKREWLIDSSETTELIYDDKMFKENIFAAKRRRTKYYGQTDAWLYQALNKYSVKDKKVLIYGSVKPWYEAICLSFGCKDITVLEPNKRICERKDVKYITQSWELEDSYDVILSISTFEHSGLGRYGDELDPEGDLKAMEDARELLDDGVLILAVPCGKDQLIWNAHRVYGEHRFPLLISGFEIVDSYGANKPYDLQELKRTSHYQPVYVLKRD
jgi:hypothetical protein